MGDIASKPGRSAVVGMVGAGQLARMTQRAAIDLGVELVVLARSEEDPAVRAGARAVLGRPDERDALEALADRCEVVTFDHEHTPAELIEALSRAGHVLRPSGAAMLAAQDKLTARRTFDGWGFAVPSFRDLGEDALADAERFAAEHGWPVVLKTRYGGYDGRGVMILEDRTALRAALSDLAGTEVLAEAYVPIAAELAVVGVRAPSGRWAAYPVVATTQRDGICRELLMPAPVPAELAERAVALARRLAEGLDAVGVIAVELFLTGDGEILVNEIALRPHNSGHATIEGAVTSQFHNHLRAVLDWPLGDTSMVAPAVAMVNVLGPPDGSDPAARLPEALEVPGAAVHLYAKAPSPGRKLGHVTALGATADAALETARRAAQRLTGDR